MDAVAVDDDRTGAYFVELGALHDGAAERHGPRWFAAGADDGRAAFLERENAEQVHVLVGGALELAAEQRGGLFDRDRCAYSRCRQRFAA